MEVVSVLARRAKNGNGIQREVPYHSWYERDGSNLVLHRREYPVKSDLDQLMTAFFEAVSFEEGGKPPYERIFDLFIDNGLLIKNSAAVPEISTVSQFIEPRV